MSYNNLFPASSLLGTPVVSTPVASAQQNATPTFDLPKIGILPVGHYDSVIVDVAEAIQNGQVVGVDCFHQLTGSSGITYRVRFRHYAPKEVEELVEAVASYGLEGSLGSLLQGLKESVDVAPKGQTSNYMHIAHRTSQLADQTTAPTSPITTTGDAPTIASPPTPCKGGGLSSRRKFGSKQPTMSRQQAILLSEDDEDDDDDWLNEDED
jgi:hypothetical protein